MFQAELHEPVIQQRKAVEDKVITLTAKPAKPHHHVVDDVTRQIDLGVEMAILSFNSTYSLDDGLEHGKIMLIVQDAAIFWLHKVRVKLRQTNSLVFSG
ncbi:hypothetical protein D9M71_690410 [compost metagenome]